MLERLPLRIDHYRYTDKGVILEGVITQEESAKDLPRLKEAVVKNAGDIEYRLGFDVDKLSNRIVLGFVNTRVILQCQRCLNDFALDLRCKIAMAFVHNDYEARNAEDSGYEIFWLEQKEFLDPRILIEDELLLALPQIPMHTIKTTGDTGFETECQIQFDSCRNIDVENNLHQSASHGGTQAKGERLKDENVKTGQVDENNPFAVLKELKK